MLGPNLTFDSYYIAVLISIIILVAVATKPSAQLKNYKVRITGYHLQFIPHQVILGQVLDSLGIW